MKPRTVDYVLKEMRVKGATLHCHYERGKAVWVLSSDPRPLPDGVAAAISRDPRVIGVGDTLIAGTLSQTFRYVE